jgi:F-type H+-transporting ATPase subunit b
MRRLNLKVIVLLLTAMLVLALVAPMTMAQDDHNDTAAETEMEAVDDGHAVEEESGGGISALGINTGFLIAQIINFLLVTGLLTIALWRPVVNMLDSRAKKIEKSLEDAAAAANARMNAETEADKILAQARTEAAQIRDKARVDGEEAAKAIEAKARADAGKIGDDIRAAAEAERDNQLASLRGQVASIGVAVAERLIGEALDEKRQKTLIDDFFIKVPAEAKALSGNVEVVSAMPLADAEQAKVKKEIGADEVTFIVNPAILGGLIVRAGDQVVDGSVSNNLTALAGSLQ